MSIVYVCVYIKKYIYTYTIYYACMCIYTYSTNKSYNIINNIKNICCLTRAAEHRIFTLYMRIVELVFTQAVEMLIFRVLLPGTHLLGAVAFSYGRSAACGRSLFWQDVLLSGQLK